MLDSVVKLTEKFAELLKYRAERAKNRFSAVVEPVYSGMTDIHQNYLDMFGSARDSLEAGAEYSDVIKVLAKARREHEASRRALIAMSQQFKSSHDFVEYRKFFSSVVYYFEFGPFEGFTSPSSAILQMLDGPRIVVYPAGKFIDQGRHAPRRLSQLIVCLQDSWMDVSSEYTKLKIATVA